MIPMFPMFENPKIYDVGIFNRKNSMNFYMFVKTLVFATVYTESLK